MQSIFHIHEQNQALIKFSYSTCLFKILFEDMEVVVSEFTHHLLTTTALKTQSTNCNREILGSVLQKIQMQIFYCLFQAKIGQYILHIHLNKMNCMFSLVAQLQQYTLTLPSPHRLVRGRSGPECRSYNMLSMLYVSIS